MYITQRYQAPNTYWKKRWTTLPADEAMQETVRVLKSGGRLCASFKADNIPNRVNDWYANFKAKNYEDNAGKKAVREFHEINLTETEFCGLMTRHGLRMESLSYVENMPFLYKFKLFRHAKHKDFDESKGRREGYLLSPLGRWIQTRLMRHMPSDYCNIYVAIAFKDSL